MQTLITLLHPFFDEQQITIIKYLITLILIAYALFINNFKMKTYFLIFLIMCLIYMFINVLLVSYKDFVFIEIIAIFISSFLPIYLVTLDRINYKFLINIWFRIANIITLLSPIYIYLYSNKLIEYYQIGYFTHLNILIMTYYLFVQKKTGIKNLIYLCINLALSIVLGSRMLLISSILTSIATMIFLVKRKNAKYYFQLILAGCSFFYVALNIEKVLILIQGIASKFNINSRNLQMFIAQIKGSSIESVSSGRDNIYPIVLEHINNRFGMPSGLAVTRYITNERFYHAHNFLLESILLFGIVGVILLSVWYTFRVYHFFRLRKHFEYKFAIYFILTVSFLIRSITGTYFLTDSLFMISFAILISSNKIKLQLN